MTDDPDAVRQSSPEPQAERMRQANAKDQKLAAALRRNLQRRKAGAASRSDTKPD